MLGIILHHIHNRFGLNSPILSGVGYLTTGMFFFISGYGNMISMNKRESVDFKWLLNKFLKIYIPFFVCYCLYYVVLVWLYPVMVPSVTEVLKDICTISLPNQVSWFPKIIVFCFAIHWICKKISKNAVMQTGLISVILVCYVAVMWKLGYPSYWYNSVFCYACGAFIALVGKRLSTHVVTLTRRILLFGISLCVFGVLYLVSFRMSNISILCSSAFSMVCYLYTFLFNTKTKGFSWIGNNSFEFYVFHAVCLQLFCNFIPTYKVAYTICVILTSVVFVYLYLRIKNAYLKNNSQIDMV